jgi:hypothetical protein
MRAMNVAWYVARLRRMGARELASRIKDEGLKTRWRRLKARPAPIPAGIPPSAGPVVTWDPRGLEPEIRHAVVAAAEALLAGRLTIFGRDVALPRSAADWFRDPDTGIAAPADIYSFDIDARDPQVTGNHKFLLEPSRLQHVTLLAAAYFLTRRDDFAALAAAQLRAWWQANPFLMGIHWTSGIEVGLRVVSFAWTRRLLEGWSGTRDCFEGFALARDQIFRHQQYLAALRSHGSSANNHLLAELLGLYVGASAFPWFAQSARWRRAAAAGLELEAARQVFPDGLSREQASEYHGFVLELLMVAAVEGRFTGRPFSADFHETIARMADAWAAVLDVQGRPPRQGDTDDAQVLLLDPADRERRPASLLAAAQDLVGGCPWWPASLPDFRSRLFAALAGNTEDSVTRPAARPHLFPDAGLAMLRDLEPRADELWCRCDHGPHGYLSIAAHAHADALSIELRHGGVDILADPGTYCYLTEPVLRRYFRSTLGHNTLEIGGQDQARFGGPFLWLDAPETVLLTAAGLDKGEMARWSACHSGYARQSGKPVHERSVTLDRVRRCLEIADRLLAGGRFPVRLAFHLGPQVSALLDGSVATLAWSAGGRNWRGRLSLPVALAWRALRGSQDPLAGWYSPGFGARVPATCLLGEGLLAGDTVVQTLFEVAPAL